MTVAIAMGLALACSGKDDGAAKVETSPRVEETTTVGREAVERLVVIEARQAALRAVLESGMVPVNPASPALAQTHTGTALDRARAYLEVDRANGFAVRPPADTGLRLDVWSVTFPADHPGVAYLETCQVWDAERIVASTGGKFSRYTSTSQLTEEMRQEGGVWKLAESFANTRAEGVTGCALEGPRAGGMADTEAVRDARVSAEHAWLAALVDPGAPLPAGSYTGELLSWFSDPREPASGVVARCPLGPIRAGISPESNDPCVRTYWSGSNAGAFVLRAAGTAFDPGSSSQVVVRSVMFQAADLPQVAYLQTCRVHDLRRADGAPFRDAAATVQATETMRWENGAWKLAARWSFQVQDVSVGCG